MSEHLLTLLIFIPVAGAITSLLLPISQSPLQRWVSLSATLLQAVVLIIIFTQYDTTINDFQFTERHEWIRLPLNLNADYFVGIDGLSLPIVALSVLVMIIATLASWEVKERVKGYFVLLQILNAAVIGTFCALDLLLFYLFFEFMLLPMFFLIGIWGGPRREYASVKFFLYTLLGSILILLVIIGLYLSSTTGGKLLVHTFSIPDLMTPGHILANSIFDPTVNWSILGWPARNWAFMCLLIGFGIKLPMVPLHTWLPDAHVEASTPISIILAALLLKIGGYGLLRVAYPLFPDAAQSLTIVVAVFGMVSIVYGAMNALASTDLKRLIAYSSVSHMGFVLLGISSMTTEGITGTVYQMISHGLISAMLFIIVGVVYDRTHDRTISNYSGLASKMPVYTTFTLIAFFAALGLPGLSGFVGEVMVFLGAFRSETIPTWIAVVSTLGLVFGAGYALWTIQRMFFGPYSVRENPAMPDLTRREQLMLFPLALLVILLGILPQLLINYINPFAFLLRAIVNHHP